MRTAWIIAVIALPALIGLTLVPEAQLDRFLMQIDVPYPLPQAGELHYYFSVAALVVALLLAMTFLSDSGGPSAPKAGKAKAAHPVPPPPAANQAEAEVVSFLATLQEKGRLVDFLMDDITAYNDAQIGAAARVVHEGCKSAVNEHFVIRPVREETEGSPVSVAAGYAADEYRLVGKISGEPPFSGTLVHRGWKTDSVKLPRVIVSGGDRLPTIAPAEVELT